MDSSLWRMQSSGECSSARANQGELLIRTAGWVTEGAQDNAGFSALQETTAWVKVLTRGKVRADAGDVMGKEVSRPCVEGNLWLEANGVLKPQKLHMYSE